MKKPTPMTAKQFDVALEHIRKNEGALVLIPQVVAAYRALLAERKQLRRYRAALADCIREDRGARHVIEGWWGAEEHAAAFERARALLSEDEK